MKFQWDLQEVPRLYCSSLRGSEMHCPFSEGFISCDLSKAILKPLAVDHHPNQPMLFFSMEPIVQSHGELQ